MPSEGGGPKRLTYTATLGRDDVSDRMGPNNIVMGWKDNEHIVFRSRRTEWNDFKGQLYLVSVAGGPIEQLPLPRGGFCLYSPDGKKLVYNWVFREFRTWKRYRGGQADDVWIFDFDTKQTTNVTNDPSQDIFPMWSGNTIYFVSDRDEIKKLNLYAYDIATKATRKITDFKEYDVKFPSLGDNAIVFENGGFIYRFDLSTGKTERVSIFIEEDLNGGRGGLTDVSKTVSNYEISPDGNRALFGSRGDIFTVPAKYGNIRNLTKTPGIHERNSKWSSDGKWIAYISDASGEDEMYVLPQDGGAPATRITTNGDVYKYQILWSPDSKKLLWADKKLRLQYVDVESKKITQVAEATAFEFSDYDWSPDSRWIAYAKPEEESMTKVYLYSVEATKSIALTDGWFSSYAPSFSADGKYLFFVSNRSFSPSYGQTEFNYAYFDMGKIYLVTLAKETRSPFEPKSDEAKIKEEKSAKEPEKAPQKKEEKKEVVVKVDTEGLQGRVAVLPITASSYRNLQSVGDKVYYIRRGSKDEKAKLLMYDFDNLKETELGDVNGFEISADGKKMLISQEGSYAIIDLSSAKIDVKEKLNLGDMKVVLDRRAEWSQIFNECWRQMRDFFYAPNMHGVDWPAIKKRYEVLVPYVSHRADLTYIIGEMIGELSAGHTYVGGGDMPRPERVQLGLLGARIDRDPATKYFRLTKILKGEVNSAPKEAGAHETVVIPTGNEQPLYYYDWVQTNLEKVAKASNGKIGYIHVPDMGAPGLNEFVKYYYPQLRKEALVLDCRGNGGGNVSPMIIERLRREIAMIDGGFFNKPEFSRYDIEGKEWIMEGHGVDPDIVVDNDPAKEFAGEDQQLDKAIQVLLDELKAKPAKLSWPPPYPDKHK